MNGIMRITAGVLSLVVAFMLIGVAGQIEMLTCTGSACTITRQWFGVVPLGQPQTITNITGATTRTEEAYRATRHYLVITGDPATELRTWTHPTASRTAHAMNTYLEAGGNRLEATVTNLTGVVVGAVLVPAIMIPVGLWLIAAPTTEENT